MFLPKIFSWEITSDLALIVYNFISTVFIVGGLLCSLRFMEFATLSESGILVKCPFRKIVSVSWDALVSIEKKKLLTYNSRGNIYMSWIVIKTGSASIPRKSRLNRRESTMIQIIASKKNIIALEAYARQYCDKCFSSFS